MSFSSAAVIGLGGISLHEDLLDPSHLDRSGVKGGLSLMSAAWPLFIRQQNSARS